MHLAIKESKNTYSNLSTKLVKEKSNPKNYFLVLKKFLNNKKKCYISHYYFIKTNSWLILEKKFVFAKQCFLINSDSSLPCELQNKMENLLYPVSFPTADIVKIINNLDSNKGHDYDEINIRIVKLCGFLVCRLLQFSYKSSLERRNFLMEWKKANAVPYTRKMISNWWKIIVQSPYYVCAVNCLNIYCRILCLIS